MKYEELKTVKQAALFLDGVLPYWFKVIDCNSLNMQTDNTCILGKLFGSYERGVKILFGEDCIDDDNPFGAVADINEWIEEIEQRKRPPLLTIEYVKPGQKFGFANANPGPYIMLEHGYFSIQMYGNARPSIFQINGYRSWPVFLIKD